MRFQGLSANRQMVAGFALPVLLMTAVAAVVISGVNSSVETAHSVEHTHQVIAETTQLERLVVDMETGERGFLITGNDEFLEPLNAAISVWDGQIDSLSTLVSDNLAQVQRVAQIDAMAKQWLEVAAKPEIATRRRVREQPRSLEFMQRRMKTRPGTRIREELLTVLSRVRAKLEVADSEHGKSLAEALAKDMVVQQTGQRGFLITGDDRYLEPFYAGQHAFIHHLKALRSLVQRTQGTESLLTQVDQVDSGLTAWRNEVAKPQMASRRGMNAVDDNAIRKMLVSENDAIRMAQADLANLDASFRRGSNEVARGHAIVMGSLLIQLESGQRRFLLTGDREHAMAYDAAVDEFNHTLISLRQVVGKGFDKRAMLTDLGALERSFQQWLTQAANPEIAKRIEINNTGTSTLEFAQTAVRRETGVLLLAEIREEFDALNTLFLGQQNHRAAYLAMALARDISDQENAERAFLITGEPHLLAPYEHGIAAFKEPLQARRDPNHVCRQPC